MGNKKINLIDILAIMVKRRKLLVYNVGIVAILSVILSLVLPNWYKSTAIILPPLKSGVSFGLSQFGQIAGNILGTSNFELPMLATRSDVYITILESKKVSTNIIKRYNFMTRYKEDNLDLAIEIFNRHSDFELSADGSIHISFEVKKDPELAAEVTNAFVEELDKLNSKIMQSDAYYTQQFIGERLEETKRELSSAEDSLRKFQKKHGTISIEDQTRATIENSAQLIAEMMAIKIQLGALKKSLGTSNSQVIQLENQLKEFKEIINDIKSGTKSNVNEDDQLNNTELEILIPLKQVPDLALEMARLIREVKIQEILYELLIQQYEQYKIQSLEDTPTIQILQTAEPSTYKSRPRRSIIVLISVFMAFSLSLAYVIMVDSYRKGIKGNDPNFIKLKSIISELKSGFKKK